MRQNEKIGERNLEQEVNWRRLKKFRENWRKKFRARRSKLEKIEEIERKLEKLQNAQVDCC